MLCDYFLINVATDYNQGEVNEPAFREKVFTLGGMKKNYTQQLAQYYFSKDLSQIISLKSPAPTHIQTTELLFSFLPIRESKLLSQRSSMDGREITLKTFISIGTYCPSSTHNYIEVGAKTAFFKERLCTSLSRAK